MTSPERWARIQELFHEALERVAEERAAFLDGATGTDRELRDEVVSLLRSHEAEGVLDGREKGRDITQDQFERVAGALQDRYTVESEAGQHTRFHLDLPV